MSIEIAIKARCLKCNTEWSPIKDLECNKCADQAKSAATPEVVPSAEFACSVTDKAKTQSFTLSNILIGHCGASLTPDKIETVMSEIETEIRNGPCAWAFK